MSLTSYRAAPPRAILGDQPTGQAADVRAGDVASALQ
jgi:hypothetical protein